MMKKMNKKAFTLIEVIVVVAIIGILVLLAVPRFIGHTQKAELVRIQHDVKAMEREMGAEFINGDDFDNWGNNIKNLTQLAQEDELFEKEGRVAKNGDRIDGTYKVIPEEYKGKINTKLKGTFYANSHGKVYYEHGKGPGYSDEEIQDKIKEGYIPIATAEDLNSVRSDVPRIYAAGTKWETENKVEGGLDKKYIQVKNISLSVYSETEEGWEPIGPESESFKGTYDGGNYVITNLEVKGDGNDYQGLFGYTKGATISNVGLIDNKVTGKDRVGGLVGYAINSTVIINSYATGSVEGTKYVGGLVGFTYAGTKIIDSYATGLVGGSGIYVGGLVGYAASGTTISNSYATGSVSGTGNYLGGLVGWSYDSTIKNSYATGEVTGSRFVGGLVGYAQASTTISSSYFTGEVTGTESVGGLVGEAFTANGLSVVRNSYAAGKVTGKDYVGGLVGKASNRTKIINSYATGEVEGRNWVGGLMGSVSNSTVSNSYATGSATGNKSVGGLVGVLVGNGNAFSYNTSINNSYATGSVSGAEKVGGFVGEAYTHTTISNSYWNTETTNWDNSSGGGTGKLTVDMMDKDTYLGWDFDEIWEITPGNYPTLR